MQGPAAGLRELEAPQQAEHEEGLEGQGVVPEAVIDPGDGVVPLHHDRDHGELRSRPRREATAPSEDEALRPGPRSCASTPRRPRRPRERATTAGRPPRSTRAQSARSRAPSSHGRGSRQACRPQALEPHLRPVPVQGVDDPGAEGVVVGGPGGGAAAAPSRSGEPAAGAEPGGAEDGDDEKEVEEPLPIEEAHREARREDGREARPRPQPGAPVLGQDEEQQEQEKGRDEGLRRAVQEARGARHREVGEVGEQDEPGDGRAGGRGRARGTSRRPDQDDGQRGGSALGGTKKKHVARRGAAATHCASRKSTA